MFKKPYMALCLALMVALAGATQAAPLAPNDPSIVDNLALWLRNPEGNYDPDAGVWTDSSGNGNDARAEVPGLVAPTLSFGENPVVFSRPFSAVHCDPTIQELLKATNLNGGQGLADLTIFSVQKVVEAGANDQRAVGFGSYQDGGRADHFNMSFDVSVRKDNGNIQGKNQDHPLDEFVIFVARMDPSVINMWFNSTGTLSLAYTATGSSYTTSNDLFYVGDLRYTPNGDFDVAEVIVFNTSLSDAQVEGISEWLQSNIGSGGGNPFASRPTPADGMLYENTWANLGWRAGYYAVSHDLYFGTSFDDVNDGVEGTFAGNIGVTTQVVGFPGFPAPEGLLPGTTYYWRVDEVNDANAASPWKGDIWSFTVPPRIAYNPTPSDAGKFVIPDATLSWTPGFGAKLHSVYFGDNSDEVANAVGALPQTEVTFEPGTLEADKTYYWRVDEFDGAETNKGDVWSFTTVPDIAVTNANLILWWTLDEGAGTTAVDWSGHGNHGTIVGNAQWVDGYQRSALTFGSDVYVEVAGYNGITGTASRTLCAWIRTLGAASRNIMSWGQNAAGQKWRMRVDATGGLRIEVNGGSHIGVTNIADGRWHHVAVTFEDDGTPDVLDTLLYVDGRADPTAASTDEPINTGTGPVRIGESPWHNQPFQGEIDDARIYDRVLTVEEIQQVMLGDTKLAGNPVPDSPVVVDIRDTSALGWSAGDTAASHDVYLGADRDAVAGADNSAAEFRGNQAGTSLSLAGLVEFGGGDYYWRIDEVESDATVIAGTIWKFTVPDYLIVDDFESYNDIEEGQTGSNRVFLTWIDGFGTTTNGSVAGNLDVPFMSPGHSGAQAMPVSYDNAGKTSEVTRTLTSGTDWTEHGVTKLVVWFAGDVANAPDRMFVALGNAVVYHPDDAATQDAGWNEWVIDLQEFADQGVDLANVGSITLGFGTRGAPVATGGMGTVQFDDIRLVQ